jgi:hypothetical protein
MDEVVDAVVDDAVLEDVGLVLCDVLEAELDPDVDRLVGDEEAEELVDGDCCSWYIFRPARNVSISTLAGEYFELTIGTTAVLRRVATANHAAASADRVTGLQYRASVDLTCTSAKDI